ncbi:Ankyrin repeat domain-containing protein 22 [Symbiodinium microadriaticum]|uniref:Ankyrin repeat domain-containing protein 22 n=1 Tax=Symbiodinium microadriaticum TaxID=2951 RepID=A0A1Q9F3P8_SYMMI|nr:Ankyrin repeat domain-containing protein 22 [Symbiodinium microadriaticum]
MAAAEGGGEMVPLPVRKLNGEEICQIYADPSAPEEKLKREVHSATCIPAGFFSLLQSEDGLTIVLESDRPWDKLFVDACTFGDVPLIQSTLPLLPSTLCEEKQGLLLAIMKKCTLVVELLLEKGVSPNLEMNDGDRALHFAACRKDSDFVSLLLDARADPTAKNCMGETAMDNAWNEDVRGIFDLKWSNDA